MNVIKYEKVFAVKHNNSPAIIDDYLGFEIIASKASINWNLLKIQLREGLETLKDKLQREYTFAYPRLSDREEDFRWDSRARVQSVLNRIDIFMVERDIDPSADSLPQWLYNMKTIAMICFRQSNFICFNLIDSMLECLNR